MKKVYKVYSEWDLGINHLVFESREIAKSEAKDSYDNVMGDDLFEDYWEDLIGLEELQLIEDSDES